MRDRARTFYRVVAHNPPTAADFASDSASGRPRFPGETDDQYHGRSVWRTLKMARRTAERFAHRTGRVHFVVAVSIPDDGSLRVVRFPGSSDHFSLVGPVAACLANTHVVDADE